MDPYGQRDYYQEQTYKEVPPALRAGIGPSNTEQPQGKALGYPQQDTHQHDTSYESSPLSKQAALLDRQSTVGSIVDIYFDRNNPNAALERKKSAKKLGRNNSKRRDAPERKPTLDPFEPAEDILEEEEEEEVEGVKEESSQFGKMASSSNTQTYKKRQSSVMFAKGTKKLDGSGMVGGAARDRDSGGGAFAGMLMDGDESSDSDSDGEHAVKSRIPPASAAKAAKGVQATHSEDRASWTSRAVAVGDRPPDSASQNPPTLKMLGLKSQKDGGAPIGYTGRQQTSPSKKPPLDPRQQSQQNYGGGLHGRMISGSDYGEDAGRHGSYIDFGGSATNRGVELEDPPVSQDSEATSLHAPRSPHQERARSPRTAALTHELGLASPLPQDDTQAPRFPPAGEQFADGQPPSAMVNPHSASIPLQRGNEQQQPRSPMRNPFDEAPMAREPPSPYRMRPDESVQGNGRQPGPQQGRQLIPNPANGGVGAGYDRRPSQGSIAVPAPAAMSRPGERDGPPPSYGMHNARPGPTPQSRYAPRPGPGFSDSPGPNAARGGPNGAPGQRRSMLRRSMAFFSGSNNNNTNGPQNLGPSNGGGPAAGPRRQPSQQRRSIFRKSMAFLTGRPNAQPQPEPEPEEDDPIPRVQGWVTEKPEARKSQYWGAGGMGDEWDVNGNGAKFWRRFSVAQKRDMAGVDKVTSDAIAQKTARRAFWAKWGSLAGGLIIIACVIGVIIWREGVATNPNQAPGALNRGNNGGSYVPPSSTSTATTANTGGTSASDDGTTTTTTSSNTEDATTDDDDTTTKTTKRRKHHSKHRHTSDDDDGTAKRDVSVSNFVTIDDDLLSRRADFSHGLRSPLADLNAGSHPLPRRSKSFGNAGHDVSVRRHHGDHLRRRRILNQSHDSQ